MSLALGLAAGAATSAYINAKYHVGWDLCQTGLLAQIFPFTVKSLRPADVYTIYDVLVQRASNHADDIFIIYDDISYTFGEVLQFVNRIASWLHDSELKVNPGDVVALYGENSPDHIMIWLALASLAAPICLLNYKVNGRALLHCVGVCNARVILVDAGCDEQINVETWKALTQSGIQIHTFNQGFASTLPDVWNKCVNVEFRKHVQPKDLAALIYTSGTTGLPKAVYLDYERETYIGFIFAYSLKLKPGLRMYTCMPLYHGAAHSLCVAASLCGGSTIVLGRKFSHSTFWPDVRKHRVHTIQYVGELCRYLLNAPPSPYDRDHQVQRVWGNGMRPDVWQAFRNRFGIKCIFEFYGATDGVGGYFNCNYGPFTANAIGMRGLLWKLVFNSSHMLARINIDTLELHRDARTGLVQRCGVNESGEALVRVNEVNPFEQFRGYYANAEASEKKLVRNVARQGDVWLRSGDLLRVDSEGRVFFVDRLGDTCRWKSENISTCEVADILGLSECVRECCVYGIHVPGADGRAICAAVVLRTRETAKRDIMSSSHNASQPNESDWEYTIAKHCLDSLPRYAVPIFLRVTQQLSSTGTMKFTKSDLRRESVNVPLIKSSSPDDAVYWLDPSHLKSDTGTAPHYIPFTEADWKEFTGGVLGPKL